MRAVGGPTLGNLDLDHLSPTTRTLITAMAIGIEPLLEAPGIAKGIDKGMDRGPLIFDGLGHFLDDVVVKDLDLLVSQGVGWLLRIDPTHPQDLVNIDVAKTGHVPLIEEEGLNLSPTLLELCFKEVQLKCLRGRFRTNCFESPNPYFIPGPDQGHPAELSRVVVTELRPIRKLEDDVGVLIDRTADGLAEVLSFHPQV